MGRGMSGGVWVELMVLEYISTFVFRNLCVILSMRVVLSDSGSSFSGKVT
jgi:hypothetical protein